MAFVLLGKNETEMPAFVRHLRNEGKDVINLSSSKEFHLLCGTTPDSVATVVAGDDDLQAIKELIARYPMLNYAVMSNTPAEAFHQATEGYGILMQLPSPPSQKDAEALLGRLAELSTLAAGGKK